tara:strand:- start:303 stop:1145 length:843 start_codon:yes stop_codon:yes gene_type:complete
MIKNKKILIIGGHGFIGKNLYKTLKKTNQVSRFGKTKKNTKNINLKNLKKNKYNFDIIFYCAGSATVGLSNINPKEDYYKNVISVKETLKYISFFPKKPDLIFISSAAVYGNSIRKKILKPISNYGKNKILAEKAVIKFSKKEKIRTIILRFFSIYGPGLKKQLIWDALNKFKKKDFIFYGTGNEIRSWMFIDDAIKLILYSYKQLSIKPQIFNLSSGENIKVKSILSKLLKKLKLKNKIIFNKISLKGNPNYLAHSNNISKKLGLKKFIKIDEGLKKYV